MHGPLRREYGRYARDKTPRIAWLMAGKSPYNAYLTTQINTASKEQLLLMLFDGAVKFAHQAKGAIERRDIEAISENCVKVQKIMTELMSALDKEMIASELYRNLMSLYTFCHKRMVAANLERNTGLVDEAIVVLGHLRQVWKDAVDKVTVENGGKFPNENEIIMQAAAVKLSLSERASATPGKPALPAVLAPKPQFADKPASASAPKSQPAVPAQTVKPQPVAKPLPAAKPTAPVPVPAATSFRPKINLKG